ncbi:metabotropic glutamate receptor [Plakobranchus ocellatus]|uniref:Metabotropic glutamate receptor n=1 Tax=Plakobranchus ocellatus TaxID=259542 RepID=A0AAV4BTC7_9GAST|nr:metabotropic glutamate receptor [Plakobranchus ocellatus]
MNVDLIALTSRYRYDDGDAADDSCDRGDGGGVDDGSLLVGDCIAALEDDDVVYDVADEDDIDDNYVAGSEDDDE